MKIQLAVASTPLPYEEGGVQHIKIGDSTIAYSKGYGKDYIELGSLRTPASKRGNGSARKAMVEFLKRTDAMQMDVELLASPLDKKTKIGKLVAFYQSLGFELTGRHNMAYEPYMRRPHK